MKKLVRIGAVIALAALSSSVEAKGLHGFYAGADIGMNYNSTDVTLDDGPANPFFFKNRNRIVRPNLGFYIGYDHLFRNCLMLGMEVFGDFNSGGVKEIGYHRAGLPYAHVKAKRKGPGFGFLTRFGTAINQKTMFYLGFGAKSIGYLFTYEDQFPAISFKLQKRSLRFLTQVGFMGMFGNSENLGWRTSYSYVPGKQLVNRNIPRVTNGFLDGTGAYTTAKFTEHTIKVGAFYRF